MFKKETALEVFKNLKVKIVSTGQVGQIMGTFGKSGKLKVQFNEPIPQWNDEKAIVGQEVVLVYKKQMMKKQANRFR